MSININC